MAQMNQAFRNIVKHAASVRDGLVRDANNMSSKSRPPSRSSAANVSRSTILTSEGEQVR